MAIPRRDARVVLPSLRAPNPPPPPVELDEQLTTAFRQQRRPPVSASEIDLPVRPAPGAVVTPTIALPAQTAARPATTSPVAVDLLPPAPPPVLAPLPRRRQTPRIRLLVAAVAVAVAATGSIAYATIHSDHARQQQAAPAAPTPAATPRTRASVTAAVRWLTANLGHDESIVAVPVVARPLTAAGFDRVSSTAIDNATWVVTTPAGAGEWSALLSRAAPVASFGTGALAVRVSSVTAGTAPQAKQVQATAAANQQLAGATLATNPRLRAPSAVVAVLQHGGLDLRAATFLAVLSSISTIQLVDLPQDPAEAAAGRARRTLVLAAPASAIDQTRGALPPEYAPQHITSNGSTTTLVWNAAVPPSLGS